MKETTPSDSQKGVEEDEMIAEFMGEKVWNYGTSPVYIEGPGFPNDPPYETGYKTSWDDLMPVVDRIIATADVDTREINNNGLAVFELGLGAPISDVYDAVIEYIKWYNSQSK